MYSFLSLPPKDPILKDHISYYYFFSSDDPNISKSFIHYPHYRSTLNIHQGSNIQFDGKKRIISYNPSGKIKAIVTNNRFVAREAQIKGKFNIIGVGFAPLGINHFINKDFNTIFKKPIIFFEDYWPDFHEEMNIVYQQGSLENKVNFLNNFFKKQFKPLSDTRISHIVTKVLNSQGHIKVSELESSFNLNRRTILRLFKRHLGCSIEEFKRTVKFRYAFDYYQSKAEKPKFTELSYALNYYDQSDFIYHFKSFAGEIPKEVLPKVQTVDKRNLHWKFKF